MKTISRFILKVDTGLAGDLHKLLEEILGKKLQTVAFPMRNGKPDEMTVETNQPELPLLERVFYWAQVKREGGANFTLKLVLDCGEVDFDTLTFDEFKHQLQKITHYR